MRKRNKRALLPHEMTHQQPLSVERLMVDPKVLGEQDMVGLNDRNQTWEVRMGLKRKKYKTLMMIDATVANGLMDNLIGKVKDHISTIINRTGHILCQHGYEAD